MISLGSYFLIHSLVDIFVKLFLTVGGSLLGLSYIFPIQIFDILFLLLGVYLSKEIIKVKKLQTVSYIFKEDPNRTSNYLFLIFVSIAYLFFVKNQVQYIPIAMKTGIYVFLYFRTK